jgi:hypothetical protein
MFIAPSPSSPWPPPRAHWLILGRFCVSDGLVELQLHAIHFRLRHLFERPFLGQMVWMTTSQCSVYDVTPTLPHAQQDAGF